MRRWEGTASQFHDCGGMTWPLIRRNASSNEASSDSVPGSKSAANAAAACRPTSGAGMKFFLMALGSDLINAATSSARRPGICQRNWASCN